MQSSHRPPIASAEPKTWTKRVLPGASLAALCAFAFYLGYRTPQPRSANTADSTQSFSQRTRTTATKPNADASGKVSRAEGTGPQRSKAKLTEGLRKALLGSGSPEDANLLASQALLQMLGTLDTPGFQRVAECFEHIYDLDYEKQRAWTFEAWGEKDGKAAFDYGFSHFSKTHNYAVLGNVLAGWAAQDPQAALTALNKADASGLNPHERAKLSLELYRGWASKDPNALVQHVLSQPNSSSQDQANVQAWALTYAAGEVVRQNPSVAKAWADTLPEGKGKNAVLNALPVMLLASDPEAAHALFQQVAPSGYSDSIYRHFARSHLSSNIEGAVEWASGFPNEDTRAKAVAAVTAEWASLDARSTGDWLNRMPKDRGQWDQALSAYSVTAASTAPETALRWATTVQDFDLKTLTLKKITATWYKKDPQAAEQWMRAHQLFSVDELERFR